MKNREIILNWLKSARSNLERAKMGKVSQGILYEDLCFDAQQAVEKSLKAILEALKIAEDVFKWLDNIIKFEE